MQPSSGLLAERYPLHPHAGLGQVIEEQGGPVGLDCLIYWKQTFSYSGIVFCSSTGSIASTVPVVKRIVKQHSTFLFIQVIILPWLFPFAFVPVFLLF